MSEKKKSSPPPSEGEDIEPPSPPSHHQKWKLAHLHTSGNYTSEFAQKIYEKIVRYNSYLNSSFMFYIVLFFITFFVTLQDSLVEQSSQGGFTLEGHHDILVVAIGWSEHPERVCGARSGVNIRQFFSSSSRQSSCSHGVSYEERMTERITMRVREELMRQFEHYDIRSSVDPPLKLDPFVPPTGKSVFYKL